MQRKRWQFRIFFFGCRVIEDFFLGKKRIHKARRVNFSFSSFEKSLCTRWKYIFFQRVKHCVFAKFRFFFFSPLQRKEHRDYRSVFERFQRDRSSISNWNFLAPWLKTAFIGFFSRVRRMELAGAKKFWLFHVTVSVDILFDAIFIDDAVPPCEIGNDLHEWKADVRHLRNTLE